MDQSAREQYEREIELGRKAKVAYDSFIKGFVEDKLQNLFNAFCEGGTVDEKLLLECKRMAIILRNLEQQILTIIETGELASKTLNGDSDG